MCFSGADKQWGGVAGDGLGVGANFAGRFKQCVFSAISLTFRIILLLLWSAIQFMEKVLAFPIKARKCVVGAKRRVFF